MPATGGVIPSQQITTVKLLKYTNPEDYVLMATEFIFIIYCSAEDWEIFE